MIQLTFSGISDAISLGFENVTFPFALLSVGLIAALVQVLIELLLRGLHKNIKKKGIQESWSQ